MTWDDDRLTQLQFDAVSDTDLSAATVALELTDPAGTVTTHTASWTGAVTTQTRWSTEQRAQVTRWHRTALTSEQFGGTTVTVGAGRVLLTTGEWVGQWLVAIGGSVVPSAEFTITVP